MPTSSARSAPVEQSTGSPTTAQLSAVTEVRILFGHQSIGMDILDAIPGVYADEGIGAPVIADRNWPAARDTTSPVLAHAYIGTNGDPIGKIRDFAAAFDTHFGSTLDIAMMKLGPVDFTDSTNVFTVFGTYSATMSSLERAHPGTTFIYTTVPLDSQPDNWTPQQPDAVGSPTTTTGSRNAICEKYNDLVRKKYAATGRLLDLAALEAQLPDGRVATTAVAGVNVRVMNPALSDDGLHLNSSGAHYMAQQFLRFVGNIAIQHRAGSPK